MVLLRRKGQTAPFTLLTLILLFGRKKTEQEEYKTIPEPTKTEPFPIPEILKKTITSNDVSRSRDRLRLASLERHHRRRTHKDLRSRNKRTDQRQREKPTPT